ncbi:hypothetical protein GWI65_04575 [Proteus sp. G2671]|nr:hypothetical protein [Proteus sp. G2671]
MLPEMITDKSSIPAFVLIAGDEDISAKIQGRLKAYWTLVTVSHSLNNSGFTTSLELEVKSSEIDMDKE